jgi:hypothetical protein
MEKKAAMKKAAIARIAKGGKQAHTPQMADKAAQMAEHTEVKAAQFRKRLRSAQTKEEFDAIWCDATALFKVAKFSTTREYLICVLKEVQAAWGF